MSDTIGKGASTQWQAAESAAPVTADRTPRSWGARGWPIAVVLSVIGLAGHSLWTAPSVIAAPWDVFILLDGAYRISEGQVPGDDFANPIGPLVYGLASFGTGMQEIPSLAGVVYGNLIFLPIAVAFAWAVSRPRLPGMYAAGLTVFVALIVVSVRPLGYSPWGTTYAMLYNRHGWALYSVLLVLVLVRPRERPSVRRLVGEGVVLGVVLGLLLYSKANFFLAGVLAVATGLALATLARRVRLAAAALGGFGAVVLAGYLAFGVLPWTYLGDVLAAGSAQADGARVRMLAHAVVVTSPVLLVALVTLVVLSVAARRRGVARPELRRVAVASAFVVSSSLVVAAANTAEHADLPALAVVPLLFIAFIGPGLPGWAGGPRPSSRPRIPVPVVLGVVVLAIATTGPIVGKDALGLAKATASRAYVADPPASQRFDADRLADFVVPADTRWRTAYRTAHAVPGMINDGLRLLRRHVGPDDTVFTVALTDPFSFALSLPPNRGGLLWWDVGIDFDRTSHPPAQRVLGDADWVMIPRLVPGEGCCQETVGAMLGLYGGYLAEHFAQVERSADWVLLERVR